MDQKNFIVAIVLSVLIITGWQYAFPSKPSQQTQQQTAAPASPTPGQTANAPAAPGAGGGAKWTPQTAAGNPDMATMGQNPRFPQAVWVGKGAPSGGGWYVKENGMIRRVE